MRRLLALILTETPTKNRASAGKDSVSYWRCLASSRWDCQHDHRKRHNSRSVSEILLSSPSSPPVVSPHSCPAAGRPSVIGSHALDQARTPAAETRLDPFDSRHGLRHERTVAHGQASAQARPRPLEWVESASVPLVERLASGSPRRLFGLARPSLEPAMHLRV